MADNEVSVIITGSSDGLDDTTKSASDSVNNFGDNLRKEAASWKASTAGIGDNFTQLATTINNSASSMQGGMQNVTHGTAGMTREFIVLGHEVMRGNFSRIPGSLMVLGERSGALTGFLSGLSAATVGWTVAAVAAVAAATEWAISEERLVETFNEAKGALSLGGQGVGFDKNELEQDIVTLQQLANVSQTTAEKIVVSFARAGNMSLDLKEQLMGIVGVFSRSIGVDAEKGAEVLIKMFHDPAKAAGELAEMNIKLNSDTITYIDTVEKEGDITKAQTALFDGLSDTMKRNGVQLTTLQKAWIDFKNILPGISFGVLAKPLEPTAPQQDNQVRAQQEDQNKQNALIIAGNEDIAKGNTVLAQRTRLMQENVKLAAEEAAETRAGNTQQAASLAKMIAENNAKAANLKEPGAAKDSGVAETQIQTARIIADGQIAIEREKNEELNRLNEETDKQYLARKIQLLDQEHALDEQSLQKQGSTASDPAKKAEINKQLAESDQKYALQHLQLTNQMKDADIESAHDVEIEKDAAVKRQEIADNLQFQIEEENNKQKLALQQITNQQYLQAEIDLTTRIHQNDVAASAAKEAADKDNVEKYQQDLTKMAEVNAAFQLKIKQQSNQQIEEQQQGWLTLQNSIKDSLTTTTESFLDGTGHMKKAFDDLEQSILKDINEMLAKQFIKSLFSSDSTSIGGGIGSLMNMTGISGAISAVSNFSMPSFDTGSWSLPGDMVANVHKGEMIIPANQAAGVRNGSSSLGGNHYYNMNFSGVTDMQSFRENSGVVANHMSAMMAKARRNQ